MFSITVCVSPGARVFVRANAASARTWAGATCPPTVDPVTFSPCTIMFRIIEWIRGPEHDRSVRKLATALCSRA